MAVSPLPEVEDGGVALDVVLAADGGAGGAVHLGHLHPHRPRPLRDLGDDGVTGPLEIGGCGFYFGGCSDAGNIPGDPTLSQVGLSFWQWPHQGAYIITMWSPLVVEVCVGVGEVEEVVVVCVGVEGVEEVVVV